MSCISSLIINYGIREVN